MKRLALVMLASGALSGCGSKSTCSDSATKEQILAIVYSHLDSNKAYQEDKSNFGSEEITNIQTIEANKDLGHYVCAAKYNFKYEGSNLPPSWNGKTLEREQHLDITYELNYLEDKKESEVSIYTKDLNPILNKYRNFATYNLEFTNPCSPALTGPRINPCKK